MPKLLSVLKTEPALVTAVVQAALALIVGLGLNLTAGQAGAIEAAVAGVLALVTAASSRPFQVAALTGMLSAAATVLVAFGVHGVSTGTVSLVNTAVVAILALVLRSHITPVATLNAAKPAKPPAPPVPAPASM